MININSYFSGAGLLDIGLLLEGLEINNSYELDATACDTQKLNFKHNVHQTDITQKLALDDFDANVMLGTYPCTKYSTIADIHGTRTGEDLFLHFFRHVALVRPDIYVVENVPGMRKFPVVMEAMQKLPDYYVSIFCPVDANIWLPQSRKRLIIIGSRKSFNWQQPEANNKVHLKDIIEPEAEIKLTKGVYNRMNGVYRDKPIISDPEKDDIAPTCIAHYAKDRSTRLVKDKRSELGVRPYTVREYARLQGVPDWFKFSGTENEQFKQIGNGVAVPVGQWIAKEIKRYYNKNNTYNCFKC